METKVLITIDNEVGDGAREVQDGFERFIIGRVEGVDYGVPKIVELLSHYGYEVDFFTSVFEYTKFGEDRYRSVCEFLIDNNQKIQLHTHPVYLDGHRRFMHEFSLDEQKAIIKHGIELIKKWTGRTPRAHRAGSYGSNDETLVALRDNGIRLDNSYFHKAINCKFTLSTVNRTVEHHGVLQIPITVDWRFPRRLGVPIPLKINYFKFDINGLHQIQIWKSIKKLLGKVEYITLFLHSFSFVRSNYPYYTEYSANHEAMEAFSSILKLIHRAGVPVTNFDEIHEAHFN